MKVLYLGDKQSALFDWLRRQGEDAAATDEIIDESHVKRFAPDIIVSFNYRHLLKQSIFDMPRLKAINLHISYLPWNRGADPNQWSHLENTPKGVTIHQIDAGLDTGPILAQREVVMDEDETLRSSYEKLQVEIQRLFWKTWPMIREGKIKPMPQQGEGSFHRVKDREKFLQCMGPESWDVPVKTFIERYQLSERL